MPRRVYWDSCTFLGLLNAEPAKVTACRAVWDEGEGKKTHIYTSFFAFAEVIKMKCEIGAKPLEVFIPIFRPRVEQPDECAGYGIDARQIRPLV